MLLPKRKLNRLSGFDYSQNGIYYITSCVQDMRRCLGSVHNGEMILNQYGLIAERQWRWLADQYPYVLLHEFIIMPNHMHGILEIDANGVEKEEDELIPEREKEEGKEEEKENKMLPIVRTARELSVPQQQIKIKSLSQLIGAFKTTSSKQIHLAGLSDFKWKRSFHDRIIRNESEFVRISNYIKANPEKWGRDRFNR